MLITPIKTPVVTTGTDLFALLDQVLPPTIPEASILVVTSKIVALSEGAVADRVTGTKDEKYELVRKEAELYTKPSQSKYELILTVKDQILAVNAGIDESNADGKYVLFPSDPYQSAQKIWQYIRDRYQLQHLGVLIVDSKTFPLKWGTMGTMLAYCGFKALNNRIGEKDLFGHEMKMTQENIAEGLAAAANVVMGEVAEAHPLALIQDLPMVKFQDRPPTKDELESLKISIDDDAYAPILLNAHWQKGGHFKG